MDIILTLRNNFDLPVPMTTVLLSYWNYPPETLEPKAIQHI